MTDKEKINFWEMRQDYGTKLMFDNLLVVDYQSRDILALERAMIKFIQIVNKTKKDNIDFRILDTFREISEENETSYFVVFEYKLPQQQHWSSESIRIKKIPFVDATI